MKKKKVIITVAIVAIAAIIAIIAWPKKSVPVEFEMTDVQPDTIRNSVTATGTIEPVTEVEVGTQVSGIIRTVPGPIWRVPKANWITRRPIINAIKR